MSSPFDDPPSENPQNPVSQVTQANNNDNQDSKGEADNEISPASVFVNSEPLREEQVQNAVKFLSHPKVRGSPVIYRRSFLERKGLTKEEIDEAFQRVPDSAPTLATTQSVVANQDGQIKSSLIVQQQPPIQVLQSTGVGPAGSTSRLERLSHFRWYHGVLAVGLLTVSEVVAAVFFKRLVIPKLKSWICEIVMEDLKGVEKKNDTKPIIAEEAAVSAAKAAAAAAADVARTSQNVLLTNSEEKRCLEELISLLNVQASEMKSLRGAIQKLEGGHNINGRIATDEQYNHRISRTSSGQRCGNGKVDYDSHSVRSLSPPAPVEPSVAPHPKSYMEIMAMIQRGEKPSNIREINDAPPNPNQPLPNPRLAPKPKPWEISKAQSRAASTFPSQAKASSNGAMNGFSSNDHLTGDNVVAGWQRQNARITEIETVDEQKFGSRNVLSNGPSLKSSWVPPQPPPVAMAEAAAAIRQPKKGSSQTKTEQLSDELQDVTNELQKITKISEMGGSVEVDDKNFAVPLNEIIQLPEEKASYLEA